MANITNNRGAVMATKLKAKAGERTRAEGEHIPDDAEVAKRAAQEEALRGVLEELYERAGDLDDAGVLALGRRLLADRCPGCPELAFEYRNRRNEVRKVRIPGGR